MRDVLVIIRRLALVGVALSVLALPLGAILLISSAAPDSGNNALGSIIGFGLGVGLIVLGVAGLILGGGLATLAKHAVAAPAEIRGSRRFVLVLGLTVAAAEVLIAAALAGTLFLVGLSAAFAAGYLVVAVASRRRAELVLAGILALALLGSGMLVVWVQASQTNSLARRMERVALLPVDMSVAVDAAAAAAPDGWAVATLAAKVTDFAPSEQLGYLPAGLIGHPLRGIIVVDCTGSRRLEVVARDGDVVEGLGSSPCSPEPQVVTIEIPGSTVRTDASATYVLGIEVDPVDEGPAGGMDRALLLVALAGTPDPDRDALLATFVAAFGAEKPR